MRAPEQIKPPESRPLRSFGAARDAERGRAGNNGLYGSADLKHLGGSNSMKSETRKDMALMFLEPRRWLQQTTNWLETSEDTDPALHLANFCEEFRPRKLKAPLVLAWIVLQAVNLFFSVLLLVEITQHLSTFETYLAMQCDPTHMRQGICLGGAWNLTYSEVINFPSNDVSGDSSGFDFVVPADKSFSFATLSKPPTFLLGIEPTSSFGWKVSLSATSGYGGSIDDVSGYGSAYRVLTPRGGWLSAGRVDWRGSISLQGKSAGQKSVSIYIVDSRVEHLDQIHKQEQCSFEYSWQKFSERHNGEHHRIISSTGRFLAVFICLQGGLLALVLYRFFYYIESGKLLRRVIALKFLIQDFPQQAIIVAYLYGWYAKNGLRCQMCLFDPLHCENQQPLHWTNFLVCIFTLLSASSNQLMLQAKASSNTDFDDECCNFFARGVILSMSALPFSTGIYLFPFWFPRGSHLILILILTGIPMVVGWAAMLCAPTVALCGCEDCD